MVLVPPRLPVVLDRWMREQPHETLFAAALCDPYRRGVAQRRLGPKLLDQHLHDGSGAAVLESHLIRTA
jgi:hypothetical protein